MQLYEFKKHPWHVESHEEHNPAFMTSGEGHYVTQAPLYKAALDEQVMHVLIEPEQVAH